MWGVSCLSKYIYSKYMILTSPQRTDIGTIQIGTPPCDYHLLMDSGSADLWVGGEGCQSDAGPGGCVGLPLGRELSLT